MWILHKIINNREELEYYDDIIGYFAWEEFGALVTFKLFGKYPLTIGRRLK